jgi:2-polyprenyl-3-methyl-5-hydroxy-6-metoxy-1,4-benzoquinol methylase
MQALQAVQSMRSRNAAAREFLDEPNPDADALERNLGDIRRINRLLGWTSYTVRGVAAAVRARQLRSFALLDLASGSADMPLAVARWSKRAGVQARIVATDISPEIVAIARKQAAMEPMIEVEQQNALDLPYAEGAFDIALCTLALHHFDPESALQLLRTMARVGTTVLVYDVVRSPLAYSGALLLTRGLRMHAVTCHDAPVSVQRAYTAPEVRALAEQAGLPRARVQVRFPFRLTLSAGREA